MKRKIKFIIIDDEPLAHGVIEEYANSLEELELIGQAYRPLKGLELIKDTKPDLVFLDIQMPKMTGLDMLRLVDNPPMVIITSAYSEYGVESYELKVADYLLKPFRFDRFVQAIETVKIKLGAASSENEEKSIFIKVDRRFIKINVSDIQYIESYGNYVKVWQKNKHLLTASTLSNFISKLPKDQFLKVHKSFFVNRENINYIEGNCVYTENQNPVPISKNFKAEFLNLRTDFSNQYF